jgi:ubiquitin-protein ligase
LADAYETLESPAVLSLAARRNGAPKPTRDEHRANVNKIDVRKVKVAAVQKGAKRMVAPPPSTTVARWLTIASLLDEVQAKAQKPCGVQRRLLAELHKLASAPEAIDKIHCFPGVDASGSVVAIKVMLTPQKGSYQGRVIEVDLTDFLGRFPFSPPRVVIKTPLYHYAVSNSGTMCLPLVNNEWSPALSLLRLVDEIYMLVVEHETFDPTAALSIR